MQWHYELVLGVGASLCLCYDAVDRLRCREDVYYLAGALRVEAYVSLVALELAVGACGAACGLARVAAGRRSSAAGRALALAGYGASLALAKVEPRAVFGGDHVTRWALCWAACAPGGPAATRGAVALFGAISGGAALHKDVGAYVVDGHAARSMLLSAYVGDFGGTGWELLVRLGFAPLGPWLARVAYAGEWLGGAAALGVVAASLAGVAPGPALLRALDGGLAAMETSVSSVDESQVVTQSAPLAVCTTLPDSVRS